MEVLKPVAETRTRNYGIDALRILSMFMVLVLHILGAGGILFATEPFSANDVIAWSLETAAFCAVNCYGLISGYVGITSKFRYTNLVVLWLQVMLYSVLETLVFYLIDPGRVGEARLFNSLFPVHQNYFWYFSAYFGLFFFIPLLNRAVSSMNRRQAKFLCLVIAVFFSTYTVTLNGDPFVLTGGYSVIWLAVLYIIGACIRKFDFFSRVKTSHLFAAYLGSILISVGFMFLMKSKLLPLLKVFFFELSFIRYTSPTILICGIALLLIFARWSNMPRWMIKVISVVSPLAFGVYIIHIHEYLKEFLFDSGYFKPLAKWFPPWMVLAVLLSAIGLFAVFAAIDKLRLWLFQKLRIKQRLLSLEEKWIGNLWNE